MRVKLLFTISLSMGLLFLLWSLAGSYPVNVFASLSTSNTSVTSVVTVTMFELFPTGVSTGQTCTSGSTKWGCTAYCDNDDNGVLWSSCSPETTKSYPFNIPTVTVSIEGNSSVPYNRYLRDVVPEELGIKKASQGNVPLSSVKAQAIAARTYAYWRTEYDYLDNSASRQVFVPYYYDTLNTEQQQRVDEAVGDIWYMTLPGSTDPIDALYGADNGATTSPGYRSYLKSISDTISVAYGQPVGTGNGGMSSKGASRWGFGHTSSRGPVAVSGLNYPHDSDGLGDFWSVRWDEAAQILTHYYTGIHIQNAVNGNQQLTPDYRWNLLDVSWAEAGCPDVIPENSVCTGTFLIQNTGVTAWNTGHIFLDHYTLAEQANRSTNALMNPSGISTTALPGEVVTVTTTVSPPTGAVAGSRHTIRFDMAYDEDNGLDYFSDREAGHPWYTYDVESCVGHCATYLPLVLKNWDGLTCVPLVGYWYPTGNVFCSQNVANCAEADGKDDGIWAGDFDMGSYLQLEFYPQRILGSTTVGVNWEKYEGDYGNLYIDVLLDNGWVLGQPFEFQGSGDPQWRWYDISLGDYEGQHIFGMRFGIDQSSQPTDIKYIVDGFRIGNFEYCGE